MDFEFTGTHRDILVIVIKEQPRIDGTDIAHMLGLPIDVSYKYVQELIDSGYLVKDYVFGGSRLVYTRKPYEE